MAWNAHDRGESKCLNPLDHCENDVLFGFRGVEGNVAPLAAKSTSMSEVQDNATRSPFRSFGIK